MTTLLNTVTKNFSIKKNSVNYGKYFRCFLYVLHILFQEIGDRTSPSVLQVRQLLSLSKKQLEVVTVQPVGCLTDTKGNKIAGFDSIEKKQVCSDVFLRCPI